MWRHFKLFKLKENMRLQQNDVQESERQKISEFSSWLLNIGNGTIGEPDEKEAEDCSWITIPPEYQILEDTDEEGIQKLISFIYDKDTLEKPTPHLLQEKAIVCPKNDTCDIINEKVLSLLKGESVAYISSDEAIPIGKEGATT